MNEILSKLDYVNLLTVSIIVTLVVSAMKISFEKYFIGHRIKILSFGVAILITFLNVSLWAVTKELLWQEVLTHFLLVWSFATLFNSLLGNWFVDALFQKIKTALTKWK